MGNIHRFGATVAFLFTLFAVPAALAPAAGALPPPALTVFDSKIPCQLQVDGVRACSGVGGAVNNTVPSWDGTPIDVNVALPDEAEFGSGPYPLAMYFHGFGGGKEGFNGDLKRFTEMGMAAFSMTERGFKDSCGKPAAIAALELDTPGACDDGFIHLMDTRYEVRDAQYLAGKLVDEGLVIPDKIGSVGASYGGTKSLSLAALKNRVMLPDASLAPWTSPLGTPMSLAAAAPIVPPSDFAAALVPNGRTLDYTVDNPYVGAFGVMKIGIISALFGAGDNFSGDNGPVKPTWDINGWKTMMEAGEPYGINPVAQVMLDEMTLNHSPYYIDDSVEPAPSLIAEGFTDDLFPIDEALRYYNRTKANWPEADISLLFADIGHPRAPLSGEFEQGRPGDKELGFERVETWFAHYLLGTGAKPVNGVEVKTQKCPYSDPSGGPFTGPTWPAMSPGELRLTDQKKRTIESDSGSDQIANAFSLLDACTQRAVTPEPGTLTYSFGTVPAGGYTLMGAPTVISKMSVSNGSESQVAARLWEISTDNKQRLIARGVYRPDASGAQVFQLHGNAYKFEPGTRIELQLLPKDGSTTLTALSYVRPSNDQQDVAISDVEIRLPLAEAPGSRAGIKAPLPEVLPPGAVLAPDYAGIGSISLAEWASPKAGKLVKKGSITARGKSLKLKLSCSKGGAACGPAKVTVKSLGKKKFKIASAKGVKVAAGKTKTVSIKLTNRGRKLLRGRGARKFKARWSVAGGGSASGGNTTIKRVGRVR